MWSSAVEMVERYGLHRTARILRLDYSRLKAVSGTRSDQKAGAFVEVMASTAVTAECVVELENARGKKMRIQLRGMAAPDLTLLSREFWSSKA